MGDEHPKPLERIRVEDHDVGHVHRRKLLPSVAEPDLPAIFANFSNLANFANFARRSMTVARSHETLFRVGTCFTDSEFMAARLRGALGRETLTWLPRSINMEVLRRSGV